MFQQTPRSVTLSPLLSVTSPLEVAVVAVISVKIPEPQFEGQTKGKLGNTYVRPLVQKQTYEFLSKYFE